MPTAPDNTDVAARLREAADLLEVEQANPFRVQSYRDAADTVERLDRPVSEILVENGVEGLRALPNIGEALAGVIREIVETGTFGLLDQLRGEVDPIRILATVPGIGETMAERIHTELGIDTLAELEQAAHDGSLLQLEGFGPKRVQAVQESLASRLQYRRPRRPQEPSEPPVDELLDVDREYREKAKAGRLRRIAPKRFNPQGVAWLPILHTRRGDRSYTVLYSNTKRAHELGKTDDWVVIYLDGPARLQWTVVTQTGGPLDGKRVVRGREQECRVHYEG